ncbi:MAG TPA: radical SAM protein [Sedimentisphaerales bacterium]|nr:radical SAM protein [Sedimentisphaerales bacterium]
MSQKQIIERMMLVQPPYTIFWDEPKDCPPPLGLAYLAAVLEPLLDVHVLDAAAEGYATETEGGDGRFTYGLTDAGIRAVLADFQPHVVGVSCHASAQWNNAHRMCRLAKYVSPDIITVMGGAHPSGAPQQTLADPCVDYVVVGEGEVALMALVKALATGQPPADVEGLGFRDGEHVVLVPRHHYIDDLDALPLPARHLLPMERYFAIDRPHGSLSRRIPNTSLITSRGCPAHCIFCCIHTISGRKFRARSPQNVLDELESLVRDYGVREVQFEDDNLTFDRERALAIFDGMIERRLDLAWVAPNGLATWRMDEELLAAMKASGCYRVHLAVESGDPDVLRHIIHKPLQLNQVVKIVGAAKRLGLAVDAFFVVGFPGETKEQIRRTFAFARSLDVDTANVFIATPYPGTELEEISRAKGYLGDIPFDHLRVKRGSITTPEFTSAELERMVSRHMLWQTLHQLTRPRIFVERVAMRIWRDPRWALEHAARLMR